MNKRDGASASPAASGGRGGGAAATGGAAAGGEISSRRPGDDSGVSLGHRVTSGETPNSQQHEEGRVRDDMLFANDPNAMREVMKTHPWITDVKYFRKVRVATTAAIAMLQHSIRGVEKGMANGFAPIEIMGLIAGRPSTDPDEPHTLIVTDVFPLPVEGTETRVLAEDTTVLNAMIEASENLERTRGRKERLMGWYHSHPFDVHEDPNYFLSTVDVSTQWLWQLSSERVREGEADVWLAIVLDPLRSVQKVRKIQSQNSLSTF